jgi:hypothetical protein
MTSNIEKLLEFMRTEILDELDTDGWEKYEDGDPLQAFGAFYVEQQTLGSGAIFNTLSIMHSVLQTISVWNFETDNEILFTSFFCASDFQDNWFASDNIPQLWPPEKGDVVKPGFNEELYCEILLRDLLFMKKRGNLLVPNQNALNIIKLAA